MLLNELFENYRLPVRRGEIPKVRGSYGAFIISLGAEDFLRLTTPNEEAIQRIKSRPFPEDREEYIDSYGTEEEFGKFNLPFLKVEFPSGRIFGHEGRHRAAMVLRKGGDRIPVVIYPYEDFGYEVTYHYWMGDEKKQITQGGFADEMAAYQYGEEKLSEIPTEDRGRIETRWIGRGILRGEPSRSDPSDWCYSAWKREDFPKVLRGQFSEYFSNDFKVGMVKGYRHHRC